MAVLGKRKASEQSPSTEDAEEIFRRHFEARFKPLPAEETAKSGATPDAHDEDDEEDSEWGGLSEEEAEAEETGMLQLGKHLL
jgi:hypothetical protein